MNLRKQEKLIKSNQQLLTYPVEEVYPLIMEVECNKKEIIAFLEDGRKVSIPTD